MSNAQIFLYILMAILRGSHVTSGITLPPGVMKKNEFF